MPEKGVREWNYEAIELTLKGLKEKNLKILNLSQMNELSKKKHITKNTMLLFLLKSSNINIFFYDNFKIL